MTPAVSEVATALARFADTLDDLGRRGSDVDQPEGDRFVTVSDTLARIWSKELRLLATRLSHE